MKLLCIFTGRRKSHYRNGVDIENDDSSIHLFPGLGWDTSNAPVRTHLLSACQFRVVQVELAEKTDWQTAAPYGRGYEFYTGKGLPD